MNFTFNFSSSSSSPSTPGTLENSQVETAQSSISNILFDSLSDQNLSTPVDPNLPKEFIEMTTRSRNEVVVYIILFIIAATGNLTVFFSVSRQLAKLKWRITVLMLHLSIADLIVTFFLMPMEIIWRLTIQWVGGDFLCKICQFFRSFGLYLSSNILICISLDRFIAILFPLRMVGATKRVKTMIAIAWFTAAVSSAPQCVVFSVQLHPKYPSFKQCVSYGSFLNPVVYNVFSVSAMYFIPLFVIMFTYGMILWKISSKSKQQHFQQQQFRGHETCQPQTQRNRLHQQVGHSDAATANLLARAKKRTLRMTFVIVIVFVFCWTPYAVINLWYCFDHEGAKNIDHSIQDALFVMAVANSCLNPIVYGNYTKKTTGPMCTFNCINIFRSANERRFSIPDPNHPSKRTSLLAITSVI